VETKNPQKKEKQKVLFISLSIAQCHGKWNA